MNRIKYPKPPAVVFWEHYQGRMPRMCFTCANFSNPDCRCFGTVPADFCMTENWTCTQYAQYETPEIRTVEEPCF